MEERVAGNIGWQTICKSNAKYMQEEVMALALKIMLTDENR
jgi:hypothetical protein